MKIKVDLKEYKKEEKESGIRINKFLSEFGILSRREADKLIAEKKIHINDRIALLGDRVKENDSVFINQELKKLNFDNIKELVIEDLKNVKFKSKLSKNINDKLSYWIYSYIIKKLDMLCDENGVLLTKVNPAYTSQKCSNCGVIDKSNRKGEVYQCNCGLLIDADYNASINLSRIGKYGTHDHKT
jgi:putative transposase